MAKTRRQAAAQALDAALDVVAQALRDGAVSMEVLDVALRVIETKQVWKAAREPRRPRYGGGAEAL